MITRKSVIWHLKCLYRTEMTQVGKRYMVLSLCNEMSGSVGMLRIWVVLSWRD